MATEWRRGRASTRGHPPARPGRAAPNRSTISPLVIGLVAGGGILLLGGLALVVLAFGRKESKKEERGGPNGSHASKGPRVDPKLHGSGLAKCGKGLEMFKATKPRIERRRSMSPSELDQLKRDLESARNTLLEGMQEIERSGAKEEMNEFQNAQNLCRKYLMELSGG